MSFDLKISKGEKVDIKVVLVDKEDIKKLPANFANGVFSLAKFSGKDGESIFIQGEKKLYYGVESKSEDYIREAGARAIRALKKYNIKSASFGGFECGCLNYALMLGILLGDYEFSDYKSKKNKSSLKSVYVEVDSAKGSKADLAKDSCKDSCVDSAVSPAELLAKAKILSNNINMARNIVNTPPQDCTPIDLAKIAQKIAKDSNLKCTIGDKKFLEKENMNAFLAVSRASVNEPRLIHLSYKPSGKAKAESGAKSRGKSPKIVVVGKGLTYDTGGLSLKPADYMTTMKADKGGGCAVLGIMKTIAELAPNIEVEGIIGASENMIGGDAYKPDDILKTREGISVEVLNTDAEGRLVLADCLSYAQDLKPDYLIDLATLTGACVVGLGEYTSGIMGYNTALNREFEEVALKSGELVAILPFNRHLEKLIDSPNADIANITNTRYGGAVSAGLFLGRFIREENKDSWIHLDIAGPAFVAKEWDINPYGASGIGIRSVVEFILKMADSMGVAESGNSAKNPSKAVKFAKNPSRAVKSAKAVKSGKKPAKRA
ncbi:leucyl aminopeptidase [Helicobacter sp. 16-1353]|uniref:leucyl aminopeptidase n=1 Tax=Helicobacter sp. 16-1353 TaxID=2004996 RepID=UPI000DCC0C98|nr:leucyl aminopeptidase [Helicobacter sp. 16-1353]RAX51824.1 leucyl aminopeptidase [Helicobacter sp. 16-1353]